MSQLRMEKCDLDRVPDIPVPPGYALRNYRPGDEAGLARIYEASSLGTETAEKVRANMVEHPCFKPERLFVVEHETGLVGTASAWLRDDLPNSGYLHMVGLLPEHRGKRLGALVSVASIRYSRQEGFSRQSLDTDDWREAAVRLYLDLGFRPVMLDDTHPERWRVLGEKLGRTAVLNLIADADGTDES